MKRLGLMGFGTVAQYGHLPAITNTPELQLTAVYDPDLTRLCQARQEFGISKTFSDIDEFYTSGIEAVVVTSPAPCHYQNVLDAARHGLPILCEKPLATSDTEASEMINRMKEADLLLAIAFCYRFSPCALAIKELVDRKMIGEVHSLRLIYNWDMHGKYERATPERRAINKRRDERMKEGGPMVDCGVHQIDLARWWLGSEVMSQQSVGVWVEDYKAPDHLYLHLDHENGAHTLVEMSYSYTHTAREPVSHFMYELIGTDGVIRYDRETKCFEWRSSSGTHRLPWHEEKNFKGLYAAFADALKTGEPGHLPSGQDGFAASSIAILATELAISRRG